MSKICQVWGESKYHKMLFGSQKRQDIQDCVQFYEGNNYNPINHYEWVKLKMFLCSAFNIPIQSAHT